MSVVCVNTHHFVFDLSNFKRKNEESVGSHLAGISITLRFPELAHLSFTATGTDSKLSVQYCPRRYILYLISYYILQRPTPPPLEQCLNPLPKMI